MEQTGSRVMASKSELWMEVSEAIISSIGVALLSTEPYTNLERVPASLPERFSNLCPRFVAGRVAILETIVFGNRSDIPIGIGKFLPGFSLPLWLSHGFFMLVTSWVFFVLVPEGFGPPALYSLSSTEIRVSWNPPTEPNGVVILYKIYV